MPNQLARLASGDVSNGACVDDSPIGFPRLCNHLVPGGFDLSRESFYLGLIEFAAQGEEIKIHFRLFRP